MATLYSGFVRRRYLRTIEMTTTVRESARVSSQTVLALTKMIWHIKRTTNSGILSTSLRVLLINTTTRTRSHLLSCHCRALDPVWYTSRQQHHLPSRRLFLHLTMLQTRPHSTKKTSDEQGPVSAETTQNELQHHDHNLPDHDEAHSHSHSIFGHSHSHEAGHTHDAEQIIAALEGSGMSRPSSLQFPYSPWTSGDRGSYITLVGLFSNIALTTAKGFAGWYMHSASLLADAGHSLSGSSRDYINHCSGTNYDPQTCLVTLLLCFAGVYHANPLLKNTHMVSPNSKRLERPPSQYC